MHYGNLFAFLHTAIDCIKICTRLLPSESGAAKSRLVSLIQAFNANQFPAMFHKSNYFFCLLSN